MQAVNGFFEDKAPRLAASITFYILLSLAPLLLLFVNLFALFLGTDSAQQSLVQVLSPFLPASGVEFIAAAELSTFSQQGSIGVIIVSILIALITASGAIIAVQDALHTIWNIVPSTNFKHHVHSRTVSIVFIMLIGVLLIASMLVSILVSAVQIWLAAQIAIPAVLIQVTNVTLFLVLITILFYYAQAALSQVVVPRAPLLFSGLITAVLFLIGQVTLTYYLNFAFSSTSGFAGTVLVFLLWVYYLVQVFLFGAELTKSYVHSNNISISTTEGFTTKTEKKITITTLSGPQKLWIRFTTVLGLIKVANKARKTQKKVKSIFNWRRK